MRLLYALIVCFLFLPCGQLFSRYVSADRNLEMTSSEKGYFHSALPPVNDDTPPLLANWVDSTGAPMLASPKFADLTGDGVDEIVLATYGIDNPYGEGWLHAWDGSGVELPGFPVYMIGAAPGTPALGDLDGDGNIEIVQGTWNFLYVFNADGSAFPGWPKSKYITQAAALRDLDADGDLEIIVPSSGSMEVYDHDGTGFPGFPVTVEHDLTAAAVGDLDGDGDLEIVSGSFVPSGSPSDNVYAWHHDGTAVAGFPVSTAGSVKAPPALADLDSDGTVEIIADCWNQSGTDLLYVWNSNGLIMPGWPQDIPYIRLSSPSVADLDLNGDLEIVVGGWSTSPYGEEVHAYDHDGTVADGFPVILDNSPSGNVNSTCTTGDIDGDGFPEILVKAVNNIYALNHDGSIAAGYPIFLDDESHSGGSSPTPAIGDPDGDGLIEIFAASNYNNVMLVDQTGVCSDDVVYWPTFRRNSRNQGVYKKYSLSADVHTISAGTGGSVDFTLDAGIDFADRGYILVGSVHGTEPGTETPDGMSTIPLNSDWFTEVIINHLNTTYFSDFWGTLDSSGHATAQLNLMFPLPDWAVGKIMSFAFVTRSPWDFASQPVTVVILP